jgi:TP901 family phage tail tape measure protein
MANGAFNLTAQINLRGPSNIRKIVSDIRKQVSSITVDITPRINSTVVKNIKDLNRSFRDFNNTLSITTANTRVTAKALNDLATSVNAIGSKKLQQNLNNAAKASADLSTQTKDVASAAKSASSGMEEFGKQSALAIRRFAAFSIVTSAVFGLISSLREGTKAFIDFDREFIRLQQVSNASAGSLQLLSKTISQLSISLGVSSKDLTTVSVTLAQAGLTIRDTEQALKALAKSALAPSFDNLNDTVEGSIALMRQFGIESKDLEAALGSVNAVSKNFAVESSDLIAAIQRTGGVFAAASKGVSEGADALNEFLALFTSVRQTTRESAETIATGLRTIFTRLQRGSTVQALEEFGIQLTDLEGKFVGPFEAIKRLSDGLSSLDPRDLRFSQIIEELGGFRQIGKVIPLIQQFAVAQQALKVAQEGTGSLAKDAATAQLALAVQISKVREEFLALIRSIGQSEGFRSLVSLSLDLTSGLIKLADAAKGVLPALTALAAIRGLSAVTRFGAGFASAIRPAAITPRGFAKGGLVPGSGNRDSVDAKLMPGEFVLRKTAVQSIGVNNLRKMNSGGIIEDFANASRRNVGAAILEAGETLPGTFNLSQKEIESQVGFRIKDLPLEPSINVNAFRQGLSKEGEVAKLFRQSLDEGIIKAAEISAERVASLLSLSANTTIPEDQRSKFLLGINDAARGNLFEDVLSVISGPPFDRDPQRPFDFPNGLSGGLENIYNNLPNKWIDAKASFAKASIQGGESNLKNKTLRQLAEEIKINREKYEDKSLLGVEQGINRELGLLFAEKDKKLSLSEIRQSSGVLKGVSADDLTSKFGLRRVGSLYRRRIEGRAKGGMLGDNVDALLTPGEAVIGPDTARSIGYAKLNRMNQADKNSAQAFSGGGDVSIVPGVGNTDSFGPVPLPVGSYVIRKKATEALGFNKGGGVGIKRFADGGQVSSSSDSSLAITISKVTASLALLAAGIITLKNNFSPIVGSLQTFRKNLTLTNKTASQTAGRKPGLGVGSLIASIGGAAAIQGVGDTIGGDLGTRVSSIGQSALSFGLIGAQIGSFLGPFGTAIGGLTGAAFGVRQGLNDSTKAIEQRNKAEIEATAETIRKTQAEREAENEKKLAEAAKKATQELAKLAQISIKLSEVYVRANALVDRFGFSLEEIDRKNVGRLSDLSGSAQFGTTSRIDEAVLKNITAFSIREVSATASRLAGLAGGGQQGRELAQSVVAQKIIKEQFPAILREVDQRGSGEAVASLRRLLETQLNQPLAGPTAQLIKEIEKSLEKLPEGTSFEEAAEQIEKLFGPIAEATEKLSLNIFTQYNNALQQATDKWSTWIEAIEKASEFTSKAADIRLKSEIDLQKALGRSLSLEQLNRPFQQNIRGLTSGLVAGGTTDVGLISQQLDRLGQSNIGIEKTIERLKGGINEQNVEQTNLAIRAQQEALARNKLAINQGTKALQELASNGDAASNALSKIQELQQRAGAFGGLVRGLLTGSPEERTTIAEQARAFTLGRQALDRGVGPQAFRNEQFTKDFFAGFERFKGLLDPKVAAQIQKDATIAGLQAQGVNVDRFLPEFGRTIREIIDLEAGDIDKDDPLLKAFESAIEAQAQANEELAKRSEAAGNLIIQQINEVFNLLKTEFPRIVKTAFDNIQADAAAIMANRRSGGGIVYASKGSLVAQGFKPRGKDTVPAMTTDGSPYMLQPGEFVVNKKATDENYGLLKAINNGDNIQNGYANRGGSILQQRADDRRQKFEEEKERRRAEFAKRFPAKAQAAERRAAGLLYGRDSIGDRGARDLARRQSDELARTRSDKKDQIFGDFLSSISDDYYRDLDDDTKYKDLIDRNLRPIGYNLLETNDRSLADAAIESFISSYEDKASQPARQAQEDAKIAKAAAEKRVREEQERKMVRAVELGIVSKDEIGVGTKEYEIYRKGEKTKLQIDYSVARPLNEKELAELAKREKEKSDERIAATFAPGNAALDRRIQDLDLDRKQTELEASRQADISAKEQINPYTGKPFENAAQKAGVEKRIKFEESRRTAENVSPTPRRRFNKVTGDFVESKPNIDPVTGERRYYTINDIDDTDENLMAWYDQFRKDKALWAFVNNRLSQEQSILSESEILRIAQKARLDYFKERRRISEQKALVSAQKDTRTARMITVPGEAVKEFGLNLAGGIGSSIGNFSTGAGGVVRIGGALIGGALAAVSEGAGGLLSDLPAQSGSTLQKTLSEFGSSLRQSSGEMLDIGIGDVQLAASRQVEAFGSSSEIFSQSGLLSPKEEQQRLLDIRKAKLEGLIQTASGDQQRAPRAAQGKPLIDFSNAFIDTITDPENVIRGSMAASDVIAAEAVFGGGAQKGATAAATARRSVVEANQTAAQQFANRQRRIAQQLAEEARLDKVIDSSEEIIRRSGGYGGGKLKEIDLAQEALRGDRTAVRLLEDAAETTSRATKPITSAPSVTRLEPITPFDPAKGVAFDQNLFPSYLESEVQRLVPGQGTRGTLLQLRQQQRRTVQSKRAGFEFPDFSLEGGGPTRLEKLKSAEQIDADAAALAQRLFDKERMAGVKGFNAGGMVNGKPGIDTNLAALTRGEFVVNAQDAPKNLEALRYMNNGGVIKPRYMQEGGSADSISSTSTSSNSSFGGYSVSLEDKSIGFMETFVKDLNTFGKDFNTYISELAKIKIPDKIEMVGRHTVEVNVTGAAAFEAIEQGVKDLINTEISKEMNLIWNQSGGQLGRVE